MDTLQDRRDALEPHAGVDRGTRQVDARLLVHLLELHEHEVPEFDEAIAVFLGRARRAARDLVALIQEDLRAIAARPDRPHGPQIVLVSDDARVGQARDLLPQLACRIVGGIDRHPQPVLVEAEIPRDEIPRKLDRALLEVVAEGKIAEHLEEGEMARGVADIVEVVVLAAGAHALLRRCGPDIGPLLQAGEDVLELHHAGIGEHQGRVVARHERRRGHDFVAVPGKIVEEARPDLVDAAHDSPPPAGPG